jgi:hypothetical protein
MVDNDEDHGKSRTPGLEDQGWSHRSYSVAERSRGLETLCAVCTVLEEMRSVSFLVVPQNQSRQFVSGLASKPLGIFSPV